MRLPVVTGANHCPSLIQGLASAQCLSRMGSSPDGTFLRPDRQSGCWELLGCCDSSSLSWIWVSPYQCQHILLRPWLCVSASSWSRFSCVGLQAGSSWSCSGCAAHGGGSSRSPEPGSFPCPALCSNEGRLEGSRSPACGHPCMAVPSQIHQLSSHVRLDLEWAPSSAQAAPAELPLPAQGSCSSPAPSSLLK